jgi:hypothetical protein
MTKDDIPTITVSELREALAEYPGHYRVSFSGLEFYRVKQRGDDILQIEFNQLVYRTPEGRVVVENLD